MHVAGRSTLSYVPLTAKRHLPARFPQMPASVNRALRSIPHHPPCQCVCYLPSYTRCECRYSSKKSSTRLASLK